MTTTSGSNYFKKMEQRKLPTKRRNLASLPRRRFTVNVRVTEDDEMDPDILRTRVGPGGQCGCLLLRMELQGLLPPDAGRCLRRDRDLQTAHAPENRRTDVKHV